MNSPAHLCPHCGSPQDPTSSLDSQSPDCPRCGQPLESAPVVPEQTAPPKLSHNFLEALLDPRAIQWLLMIGGGLSVLGLLIYLVSTGLFQNPIYGAAALGIGSLVLLGSGWGVVFRTRYRMAGQALTFLACVLIPLNLWFYDTQGILQVEDQLWVAGLVCCTLYVATVYVLRDPLFLYAVEAGITLTVMLFLGHRGWAGHLSAWSVATLILGLSSLHLEQAFPAADSELFSRKRFGKPLFHSGLLQLIAASIILLIVQTVSGFTPPHLDFLGYDWSAGELVRHPWLAAGIWLLAMYGWFFAEWQHPSRGLYFSLGIVSLTLAEVTLVAGHFYYEGAIAVMTITALLYHLWLFHQTKTNPESEQRRNSWIGLGLLGIPASLGLLLQIRALAPVQLPSHIFYQTGNYYLPVMLLLGGTALIAARLTRNSSANCLKAQHFLAATAFFLAASETLRDLGYGLWLIQGAALIPLSILSLLASRVRRGTREEQPLALTAEASIVVLGLSLLAAALIHAPPVFLPIAGELKTLLLGTIAIEFALFYSLVRFCRQQTTDLYLATIFLVAALWQFLGYGGIVPAYYSLAYALLGTILIIIARLRGVREVRVEIRPGLIEHRAEGPGLTLFHSGNALYLFAVAATLLQGYAHLIADRVDTTSLTIVGASILLGLVALLAAFNLNWKRTHLTLLVWQVILFALILNKLSLLSGWQKLEIASVALGLLLFGIGCFTRLRKTDDQSLDGAAMLLAFGSLLAIIPPFIAFLHYRIVGPLPSLPDEFALLTIAILMLIIGLTLQLKSPTLCGATGLTLYLGTLIVQLAYHPQVAIGVYLAAGGILIFALGITLSIYRERLLDLPEKIANREGIFRIIDWR